MTKPTLTYFDAPVSRGEECRLAFFIAGVPFTDERLTREQWEARKPSAPFGALPMLSMEGKPTLAQSNAILVMIGRQHGLLPSDAWECARHEAVMASVEELRGKMGPITHIKDPGEKKAQREALASGYLPQWCGNIEKQITGQFLGGASPSVADIKLFVVLSPIKNGKIDHVSPDVLKPFTKVSSLIQAMASHPKVVAWNAR